VVGAGAWAAVSHLPNLARRSDVVEFVGISPKGGREAFAAMSAPLDAPVELHGAIVLTFASSAIGTMTGGSTHIGVGSPETELDVHVIGSQGQFALEVARGSIFLGSRDGGERVELGARTVEILDPAYRSAATGAVAAVAA
jgi:predicted dehydrogenase